MRKILTGLEARHSLANIQDHSSTLMAETVVAGHDHWSNVSMFPEVYVRATDTGRTYMYKTLIWRELGNLAFYQPQVMSWAGMNSIVRGLLLEDFHGVRHWIA